MGFAEEVAGEVAERLGLAGEPAGECEKRTSRLVAPERSRSGSA